MIKSIKSTVFCVLFIIIGLASAIAITASTMNFDSSVVQQEENIFPTANSTLTLQDGIICHQNGGNISVSYILNSESTISNVTYTQVAFSSVSVNVDTTDSKKFNVTFTILSNSENCHIAFQVTLASGEVINTDLYAVRNNTGVFLSQFSNENAYYKYLKYLKDENIITEKQYENLIGEFSRIGSSEISANEISNININIGDISVISTNASNLAYAQGYLFWKDDLDGTHPLRGVKVEIRNPNSTGSSNLLATLYTDSSGQFFYPFDPTVTEQVKVWIYAGDDNVMVINSATNNPYYIEEIVTYSPTTGISNSIFRSYSMISEANEAFQIAQALMTARDYADAMIGYTPNDISAFYPAGSGYEYNFNSSVINITKRISGNSQYPNSYADWDMIIMEYGHHVESTLGLSGTTNNNSAFSADLSYLTSNKTTGITVAWSEGWAAVFSLMAQQYMLQYNPTQVANIFRLEIQLLQQAKEPLMIWKHFYTNRERVA